MNEKYVIDKIKEIEEAGATPKEHTHTVSDISDMPSEFTPAAHGHAATEITSGTLDAARIPALDAGKITSGTLDTARIPALDAGKITSGTLAVARIPSLTASKISDFEAKVEEIAGGASGDITSTSFTVRYQSTDYNRIGSLASPSTYGNSSPYCINMAYHIKDSSSFTTSTFLNMYDTYRIGKVEGNYTYSLGAYFTTVTTAQETESLKIVCNGKTYTTSAGGTTNLTLAQVNELLNYKSTITITSTYTSQYSESHTGNITIRPTTESLYMSLRYD